MTDDQINRVITLADQMVTACREREIWQTRKLEAQIKSEAAFSVQEMARAELILLLKAVK